MTHSPALAKKADKIFYFENGGLSREGNREELRDIFQELFGEGGAESVEIEAQIQDAEPEILTRQKADTTLSTVSRKSCLDGMNQLYEQNKKEFEAKVNKFQKGGA